MSVLRRALLSGTAALAAALLIASTAVASHAAPTASPWADHRAGPHSSPGAKSADSAVALADTLPFPVTTGITENGQGIWLYADTDSPYPWNVTVYDPLGNEVVGMTLVEPKTRVEYPISVGGGWHDVYLTNHLAGEEVYVESYDLQNPIERNFGLSRFETSAAISADSFKRGVSVAYVANGLNFPDALSGAPAGGHLGGPVLLTRPTSLPDEIALELERLAPSEIVVLGGPDAVSDAVKTQLGAYTSGSVRRLGGISRYDTSALISADAFDPGVPVAYVASGLNFPDALSGAAAAGALGGPVLLTSPTSLPAAIASELERLDPERIVVLGGSDVVSPAVASLLAGYTQGTVDRLAGTTRFDTAVAISEATFAPGVPVAYLANAFNFPDALSGAAAAGMLGGPVLLTRADSLEPSVIDELDRLDPRRIIVLGGPDVVHQMMVGTWLPQFVQDVVQRTGGTYESANPAGVGPTISNVVISSNSLSVTVSFDYVHPAGWWTPVYVGIYPGAPADYPYGDLGTLGDYGLNDEWGAWMYMPEGTVSGHASQSFPIHNSDGPLTVMLFGSNACDCEGGTEFVAGRDFAALP